MKIFNGVTANGGYAIGRIYLLESSAPININKEATDPETELERLENAVREAEKALTDLYESRKEALGTESAEIFKVHRLMLRDADFTDMIKSEIMTNNQCAEAAVVKASENMRQMLLQTNNEYMMERADDVRDISERILAELSEKKTTDEIPSGSIIVSDDLLPSRTASLDRTKIEAFVTVHGAVNSHTAILARTINIPAIVRCDINLTELKNGDMCAVNGEKGIFYFDPTREIIDEITELKNNLEAEQEKLKSFTGKPTHTADGRKIRLYANVGSLADLDSVISNDAEGIGLFRSEFIFIKDTAPTEDEQYIIYKKIIERMSPKRVIIRTLDIGADKKADCFNLPNEENPALGFRGIRISLKNSEIFKTQLKAIYRAAVFGNTSIMYPMIISIEEIEQINKISLEVEKELSEKGIPYKVPEKGIMIETPAAALISDELAKSVDFFSIGSNDLSQYTMAIDRNNELAREFFNPHHKAILREIKLICENAHKNNCWVGICGDLAYDEALFEFFLAVGIYELSMPASKILSSRSKIASASLPSCDEIAAKYTD